MPHFPQDNDILLIFCYSLVKFNTFERVTCHLMFAIKETFKTLQPSALQVLQYQNFPFRLERK